MENINREIELESRSRRYTDRLQSANIKIKEIIESLFFIFRLLVTKVLFSISQLINEVNNFYAKNSPKNRGASVYWE